MQPRLSMAAAFCLVAVSALLCTVATPAAFAKPSVVEKSSAGGKKATVASKSKKFTAKKRKPKVAATREPAAKPEARTPTDKQDCISVAQAYYRAAGRLSKQAKQDTPKGFIRVVSKLSELCGEEEFDKARTSIDWMDACLRDLAGNREAKLCSSHENLLCSVDPQSKECLATGRVAEH